MTAENTENESHAPNRLPYLIAHIGLSQNFSSYLFCYERAVERLFAAAANGEEPVDIAALPLVFLMRHSMELGYKFTLWELHQMNEEPYDGKAYGNHGLRGLHAALRSQYGKAAKRYAFPEAEMTEFENYCQKTEVGMKLFDFIDNSSFKFRYPMDKAGGPSFQRDEKLDLAALKLLFDDSMVLLRHTADVLGEYVDHHRWMESEYGAGFE